MNIIQQFKDASGNNIYPIGYSQGGCKIDLLWTNPSPTSDFAAQTISLDLSEYALILVRFLDGSTAQTVLAPIDNNVYTANLVVVNGQWRWRNFVPSVSGVTFDIGKQGNDSYASIMRPFYIYGIKMSYIVPTSVHGLQYVEV